MELKKKSLQGKPRSRWEKAYVRTWEETGEQEQCEYRDR